LINNQFLGVSTNFANLIEIIIARLKLHFYFIPEYVSLYTRTGDGGNMIGA